MRTAALAAAVRARVGDFRVAHVRVAHVHVRGALLRALILWALGAVTLFSADPLAAQQVKPTCGGDTIATGEVARVIDGRTFVLADGSEARLAAVEAPPAVPGRPQRGACRRRPRRKSGAGSVLLRQIRRSQVGGARIRPLRPAGRPGFRRAGRGNLGPVRNFDKRLCAGSPGRGQSRHVCHFCAASNARRGPVCSACGATRIS